MISPERSHELSRLSLHYAVVLRSIAFWGHVIILWILMRVSDEAFPITPVFLIMLSLGIVTLFSTLWAKRQSSINSNFVFLQLMTDIFFLTLLLYYTGGSSNPFVSLYMLPVTFAAALLRPLHIGVIAIAAVIAYSGLMWQHNPMQIWQHHGHGFTLHIWGMWCGFLLSAGLVAYFVTRIGMSLRTRDQLLAEARERGLEAEKIAALGALAAGTAHELGTPLSTIAILSKDLEKAYAADPKLKKKLGLLRSQVDRCKGILSTMAATAGQSQADAGRPQPLDRWLTELFEEWRGLRPTINLKLDLNGQLPSPAVITDRTISQSIVNVLNNAAEAANDPLAEVDVSAHWDDQQLDIIITDYGPGLSDALLSRLGEEPFLTTKAAQSGLGLGVYLARSTLARLGGDLTLINRSEQPGVIATIIIPLDRIRAEEIPA